MSTNPAGHRIYLVDDHPLVREWLSTLLRRQSDLVVCGEQGEAGAALGEMEQLRPELAIVDLSLGDASGLELIKDMRQRVPEIKVLVLSMHEEAHYAERAVLAGARGYVAKRESTGRIVEAIREVLAGRLFVTPEVAARLMGRALGGKTAETEQHPRDLLSDRELEVFERLGQGASTKLIAETLHISQKTVQEYCARIKLKLSLSDNSALIREAVRWSGVGRSGPSA